MMAFLSLLWSIGEVAVHRRVIVFGGFGLLSGPMDSVPEWRSSLNEVLSSVEPVVIRGAVKDWPACKWTPRVLADT